MKKHYFFGILFSLITYISYGQNCAVQKNVSDDEICNGEQASIVVSDAVAGETYQLLEGATLIDSQTPGSNGDITFNVSPTTSTDYTVYNVTLDCFYTDLGSVTVNPIPTAVATNPDQERCSGLAILAMNFSGSVPGTTYNWTRDNTVNVTGINSSGSGNITGTLTNLTFVPQTVTFTITPTANGCDGTPITTTVLVKPEPDALASISTQTICSNTAITPILLSGNVAASTFTWTRNNGDIASGIVTGIAASGSGDISGTLVNTTTTPRTVTFTITPHADGCNGTPITVTVIVNPTPVANASVPNQTRCSGVALGSFGVTSNVSGTTYAWVRDNTINVTGIADNGTGTITGTLTNNTNAPQTVNFTITPTANGCDGASIIVSALINPTPDVSASTGNQVICSGDAITNINFSGNVAGTTFNWIRNNGDIASGIVQGIASSGSGNISGSLTNTTNAPRTVRFTITPTANSCDGNDLLIDIVVNPIPVISASAPNQTRCSGVALGSFGITSNVSGTTYAWVRDNTVNTTGIANNGTGTISGTLTNNTTSPQTVNFTITPTANGCTGSPFSVSALINPRPNNASAAPQSQSICSGDAISTIILSSDVAGTTYNWTRSNFVNVTGIPSSGSGDISGSLINNTSANQTVTFTIEPFYTTCEGTNFTATVTVFPTPTAATVTGSQTICSGNPIATIAFTGISGTSYNWTRDNNANVTGIASSGSGSITGTLTNTTGVQQTVQFTITPVRSGCSGTPIIATVTVEAISVGGAVTISQPNITPVINVTTVCHVGNGTLYLSGHRGNVVRWEFSTNAGINWTAINNTSDTYNYANITQTTVFRAVVQNGPLCALAYSSSSMINVIPNIKPNPVTATPSTICNGDSSVLTAQSGFATSGNVATGGDFSNSNPTGWMVGGCGNCLNAGSSNTNPNPWQLSATNGGTYSGVTYTSSGKFAIVNGAFAPGNTSYLYTPTFNTFGLTSASLTFADAYNLQAGASISIQISVNGGTYTTLWSATGPASRTPYLNFNTNTRSIDLSAYLGQPNIRIRFAYIGNTNSSWAVDNIAIPETPLNLSTQWVDATTGTLISNNTTVTVTPSVTTTYAVTSFLNGCNSFGTDGTAYVTVTVNPRPTAVLGTDQYVCFGGTATLTVTFTGTGPWRFTYTNGTTSTTVSNINTNPYNFNITNVTSNQTYTITALNDSRCTALPADITGSATITVLNGTPGVWTGLVSTDWFDCRNWQRGLPTATIDALIPSGMPRMPIIDPLSPFAATYSFLAIARDITISPGASVTMAANSNLHIKRNWMNSGSFVPGTGTVTFNSSTASMIQYMNNATENNFFENYYNLTLNCTNSAIGVYAPNFLRLTVANDLTLTSGDLRLVGEAQLVQNGTVANPAGGTGKLIKDQQGTKSSFHYNYWSSPVSSNNTTYTVGEVLRDGTNSGADPFGTPNITFGNGVAFADGALTNPIRLSNNWIYKYTIASTSYYSWQLIGSTGSVKVGEGYTMKGVTGTAPNTEYQNYIFAGKPNNGTFTLNIALNQLYLIGNPYASALDANAFIMDNIKDGGNAATNVFNGALYFWDHFGGQSHYLAQYVGGYATYTLMGGVVAISNDPLINDNNTTGSKIPRRYIPVAQGFFIRTDIAGASGMTSPITGGNVVLKNSQRAFRNESPANSVFFRNQNEIADTDNRSKIRLAYESPSGLRRQLLLGADNIASNQFDIGYDAPMADPNREDMYWNVLGGKFVIQAVKDFNPEQILPIGLKVAQSGVSKIKLDDLENIPQQTQIYLYDNQTGIYHDLRAGAFEASLPIAEYNNRFSIRFSNVTLGDDNPELTHGLYVFVDADNILNIKNNRTDLRIEEVQLFNLIGQSIKKWDVEDENQPNILLPVQSIRSGVYIVNLKTSDGLLSKKIVVK
ncbi:PKD-like domain-containing protein [Flavobacterium pedocola]